MFFYVIGQCNCNSGIPVDILVYFNKISSKQVERINCKNVFLLLLHKCLKACIYANSLVLRLYDFSFSWNARKSQSAFQKNQSGMRKFYLENSFAKVLFSFDVSLKLTKWNAWDQFQTRSICFALELLIKSNTHLISH